MSNTSTLEKNTSVCANCGKGEEASIKLKACTACKLVKYCNRDCQIAHRSQHKKECRKRAAELRDEKLFRQPPPEEDCPICFIRLPSLPKGKVYMVCCGKVICAGCCDAPVYDNQGNVVADLCPFCRTPPPTLDEFNNMIKRYKKRAEMNDAYAIYKLGCMYRDGECGLPQDMDEALKLWHRAAKLGSAVSYHNIGYAYYDGIGVEVDLKKAAYYWGIAAMRGHTDSRHNLGAMEEQAGNNDRALKHFMIAVKDGDFDSLEGIKLMYNNGHATKDDYNTALQSYQAYVDEIKSDQRDEAAAAEGCKYYESGL